MGAPNEAASTRKATGGLVPVIQSGPEGHWTVKLHGHLNASSTGKAWRTLRRAFRRVSPKTVEVDARGLILDGNLAVVFLRWLLQGGFTPGAQVHLSGLSDEQSKILEAFGEEPLCPPSAGPHPSVVTEVGAWTRRLWEEIHQSVAFVGQVPRVTPGVLLHKRMLRWKEVRRLFERSGVDALPVVGIFSALVGFVLALEASQPLRQFGAQLYIADMIGFATIRDTGPLVTAIMLAGRSGSAFAAELGTMKVNQELDALKTMGLNPVRFLVVQRMLAMVLVSPLLTVYAMVVGMLGGVTVMRFMGYPPRMIYHQIISRVHLSDFAVGLVKSVIFGLIVGGIGCLRGLQTEEGPSAVGVATTRAVVSGILLIILGDTLISMVLNFFSL